MVRLVALGLVLVGFVGGLAIGVSGAASSLPRLGPAADFSLTDQNGDSLSLGDLTGRPVLVSFMFTRCVVICSTQNIRLVGVKKRLEEAGAGDVRFVSITVDPKHDTPETLATYAESIGADDGDWAFLTGPFETIAQVARGYGVLVGADEDSPAQHNLLLTLVDRKGVMRVQYLGERFDADELFADLVELAGGAPPGA